VSIDLEVRRFFWATKPVNAELRRASVCREATAAAADTAVRTGGGRQLPSVYGQEYARQRHERPNVPFRHSPFQSSPVPEACMQDRKDASHTAMY